MSDAKQIKQLLLERVADLAPHLFPNGKKEGNHWRVGSIEGEAGKSFDVCIAAKRPGFTVTLRSQKSIPTIYSICGCKRAMSILRLRSAKRPSG